MTLFDKVWDFEMLIVYNFLETKISFDPLLLIFTMCIDQ